MGRLIVGIVLVVAVAFAAILGLARLVGGPAAELRVLAVSGGRLTPHNIEGVPGMPLFEVPTVAVIGVRNTAWVSTTGLVKVRPTSGSGKAIEVGRGVPLAFSANGRLLVQRPDKRIDVVDDEVSTSLGPADEAVFVGEDVATGTNGRWTLHRADDEVALGSFRRVHAASPDGKQLLVSDDRDELIIHTIASKSDDPSGFTGEVDSVAVSPQGVVAVNGRPHGKSMGIWLLSSEGAPKRLVPGRFDRIMFLPDAEGIIATSDTDVRIYDSQTAGVLAHFECDRGSPVGVTLLR